MWAYVFNKVKMGVAAAVAIFFVLAAIVFKTKDVVETKHEKEELENYKETRERIDETPVSTNVDDALDRLSKHGQLRD